MIIYYNKQTMKQTQTQSEDTIPMTDELMADYRHYAGNLNDKSLELIQEVGQVPYLEYYELDDEGNRYSHYKADKVDGVYVPDLEAIEQSKLEEDKAKQITEAKKYLLDTDFKVLPDYDQDSTEVKVKRQEARDFIRANEGDKI